MFLRRRGRPGPKPRLSRAAIVDMAIARHLHDINMRGLAADLGVSPAALYRYFPDRDALAAAIADEVCAALDPPSSDLTWQQFLQVVAADIRRAVLAHPRIAEPRTWVSIGGSTAPFVDRALQILFDAGFSERDAVDAYGAASFVGLTYARMELAVRTIGADQFDPARLAEHYRDAPALQRAQDALFDVDVEHWFQRHLEWLIAGIAVMRAGD